DARGRRIDRRRNRVLGRSRPSPSRRGSRGRHSASPVADLGRRDRPRLPAVAGRARADRHGPRHGRGGRSSNPRYHARVKHTSLVLIMATALLTACTSAPPPPAAQESKPSGDAAFTALAGEYLDDLYKRQPTQATYLGIHKYDDTLDDYSRQAVDDAVASARGVPPKGGATEAGSVSLSNPPGLTQLAHA